MCGVSSVSVFDRSYATLLIVLNDPSDTPFPVTVKTQRSCDTESASDDTIEQNHDVGISDPPHVPVELTTPVHHLDERPVTSVDDTNATSHYHQHVDYPGVVPNVPSRSLRQMKKPMWLADYETL